MQDGIGLQYDPIQGQGQGHEFLKVGNPTFSKAISSAIYNGSWKVTTDSKTMSQYINWSGRSFDICPGFRVT